jgi:hypothetical protein
MFLMNIKRIREIYHSDIVIHMPVKCNTNFKTKKAK